LDLTLSEEKTKITDLHKDYAKFLGYRIKNCQRISPLTAFTANWRIRNTGEIRPVRIRIRKVFKTFIDIDHERVKCIMRL